MVDCHKIKGADYSMINGEIKCYIFGNTEKSFLTIVCSEEGGDCESILISEGDVFSRELSKNYFANYFVGMSNKTLPGKVKKIFAGNFGIQVWQPFKFDPAYKLPIGFITEEKGRSCKIGFNEDTIHIFAESGDDAQTITIKGGKVIFDDGGIESDYSCHAFQEYFAELAKELPEEVKKLFNGCYGIA